MGLNLTRYYSINFDAEKRIKKSIKFIIIHYTGMKKESESIERLCNPNSRVSCHYFIKNNGKILNLIPDLYRAWHAGKSSWKNYDSLNDYSIGVEINNPGHEYVYKKFTSKQINSLIKLLNHLVEKFNLKKQNILGHSDVSPNRKKDPGEKFPWKKLAKKNLCSWHFIDEKKSKRFRKVKLNRLEEKLFMNNLYNIGYSKKIYGRVRNKKTDLITAFQRRFRQNLINGMADKECYLMSKKLVSQKNSLENL